MRLFTALAVGATLLASTAQAETKLEVWHVFNLKTDMIYDGIKGFEEAHPDVTVDARVVPFAQLRQELIRAIATGDVPDVVTIDNPVIASFAAQGALEEIGPGLEKRGLSGGMFYEGPWSSVTWNGKVYGAPRASNTIALYYNADMFKAAGLNPDAPPKTWAELEADAKTLTDKQKNVYGLAFSAVQSEEGTFQFLPFLQQAGGDIAHLDSPASVSALQFLTGLVKNGYVSKDVVNMRQYEATNTMINGNAAMAISGPWELPRIAKQAKFDWRVAELPVKAGVDVKASALGGFDWAVPKGARHMNAALDFIAYMNSKQVLEHAWASGRLPSRKDVEIANPLWPKAYKVFHASMQFARARGPNPDWPQISLAIQNALQEALTFQQTPAKALAKAAGVVDPILKKTGALK